MTPRYRAALFDLDDTIFDHQLHRREALTAVAQKIPALCRIDLHDLEAAHDVHLLRTHSAVLDGSLSVADGRIERMRGLLLDFGVPAAETLASRCEELYREAYDRLWRAVPGAAELLESLRESGIWIGVITNGLWSEQSEKLKRLGLESVIHELIVSELVGSKKPTPEFFSHAVARARFACSECVVVGDSWDIDIQGALNFGLDSIWLNRYDQPSRLHPGVTELTSLIPIDAVLRLFLNGPA